MEGDFLSPHNTVREKGREERGEDEREILQFAISSPLHYYILAKMYINTLNVWTTYDKMVV